jgi:hypothetical protein
VLTAKVVEAESPEGFPVAVTPYEPSITLATTKDASSAPLEIEQVHVASAIPDNEQALSPDEKPKPYTSTIDPAGAEPWFNPMDGTFTSVVVVWLDVVVASVELVVVTVEVVLVCVELEVVLLACPETKSSLTFAPVKVTVLVIGPNPGPEAVTVIVPDVPTGTA